MTSSPSSQARWDHVVSKKKKVFWAFLAGALVGLAWYTPVLGHWLKGLERDLEDVISRVRSVPVQEDFVFLGIDEASLSLEENGDEGFSDAEAYSWMSQRFPWDRRVYARAIEKLMSAGARLVIIDLLLVDPSADPESDEVLAAVIEKYRDRIVMAGAFSPIAGKGEHMVFVEPLPDFLGPVEGGTAFGYVSLWPHQEDGIVREVEYFTTGRAVNHMEPTPDDVPIDSLAGAAGKLLGYTPPKGRVRPVWSVSEGAGYEPVSFYEIFVDEQWQGKFKAGGFFHEKIVMIGSAAERHQDQHQIPVGLLDGPEIHLRALAALRTNSFYQSHTSDWMRLSWLLLGVVLATALVLFIERPVFVVLGAMVLVMTLLALAAVGTLVGILAPVAISLLAVASIFVVSQVLSLVTERLQKMQVRQHLERSLSPNVAEAVIAAPDGYYDAARGGKRLVAVLFSDVRGFTERSEQMDPVDLVTQLNEYFSEMTEAVFSHGGTLDKFIGDAVMASWGGIKEQSAEEMAGQSVAAARDMLERLARLNQRWAEEGREGFEIGIGVHLGEAVAGELGSESRSDFTVLGDAVNLAARIEGFTKQVGVPLVISEEVWKGLGEEAQGLALGRFVLKGKKQAIGLYAPGYETPEDFAKGLELLEAGDLAKAKKYFASLKETEQWARLGSLYHGIDQWDGEVKITEK